MSTVVEEKIDDVIEAASEAAETPVHEGEDDFDLTELRLSQDFEAMVAVKKTIMTVPVRKPHRQEFVRVHPSPDWRIETLVIEVKEDNELYLVHPSVSAELAGEVTPKVLFTAVNRQGVVTLWPVSLPGADGRTNEWNRSALEAAKGAMNGWVQVKSNRSLGAYEVFTPAAELPEPEWPSDIDFRRLLQVAFKDRFITSADHPVVRRLRGLL